MHRNEPGAIFSGAYCVIRLKSLLSLGAIFIYFEHKYKWHQIIMFRYLDNVVTLLAKLARSAP